MIKRLVAVCLLVGFFGVSSLNAADTDSVAVLKRARQFYASQHYDSTVQILTRYLRQSGKEPAAEYLVPLLAEALSRKNDFASVSRFFTIYAKKFASSPYMPRMRYLQGYALGKTEAYAEALGVFSQVVSDSTTSILDSLTLVNVRILCERALSAEECALAADRKDLHETIREIARHGQMVRLFEAGQFDQAREAGELFKKTWSNSTLMPKVNDLLDRIGRQLKNQLSIGLLAPVSGAEAEIGKRIVQGVQVAFEQFNSGRSNNKVSVIIRDSRGSMVETAHRTKELLDDYNVPVIIGPVLSQNAIVSAAMCAGRKVVMISPTATEDGIADLAPNIFQMNITMGVMGSAVANYALQNLNIRDYAVLAPSSDYGQALSRHFVDQVKAAGGTVVAQITYPEGTNDFKLQFDTLRTILVRRYFENMSLEKSDYQIRKNAKNEASYLADSTLQLGGLFIPAESQDAAMLASQTAFHRIKTQLLGSSGWHNPATILDGREYVNNAVLSTTMAEDTLRMPWNNFKAAYKARFGTTPDRIAALGYDAAGLVLKALAENGMNADTPALSRIIAATKKYEGASGVISFDRERRVNVEAAIVKIRDKSFIRLQ